VHRGYPNLSEAGRRAYGCVYGSADVRHVEDWGDRPTDFDLIEHDARD
jgi:hypothetical protein